MHILVVIKKRKVISGWAIQMIRTVTTPHNIIMSSYEDEPFLSRLWDISSRIRQAAIILSDSCATFEWALRYFITSGYNHFSVVIVLVIICAYCICTSKLIIDFLFRSWSLLWLNYLIFLDLFPIHQQCNVCLQKAVWGGHSLHISHY